MLPPFALTVSRGAERIAALSVPGTSTLSAPVLRPSAIVLLVLTMEPAPIAVAKLRFDAVTSALAPTMVLLLPVVFVSPATLPKNELPLPRFPTPAFCPKKEFENPVVFVLPAPAPKNELPPPLVLSKPALKPKNELNVPAFPAAVPRPRTVFPVPDVLRMRLAPMLYPTDALKTLADPVPLMLKLLAACSVFRF